MKYGIYTYYKMKKCLKSFEFSCFFFVFRFVFEMFEHNVFLLMYFGVVGVFCTTNCYFEYRILFIFLYIRTDFKDIFHIFFEFK